MLPEASRRLRVYYQLSQYISHHRAGVDFRALLPSMCDLVGTVGEADVVVLHDEPPTYPRYFEAAPELRTKVVVGYALWEATDLPPEFLDGIRLCNAVWTCSEYCRKAIAKVHDHVRVVPFVVPPVTVSAGATAVLQDRLRLDENASYLLSIVAQDVPRKNTAFLLDVFGEFHAQHPGVRLLMKHVPAITLERRAELAARGIEYVEGFLDEEAMGALHALSVAHLSLHHSEGWGLGLSDAMAHGRPGVASAYSGNLEFMTNESSYFVACTEGPIAKADLWGVFREGMCWGYPDRADALRALGDLAHDIGTGAIKAKGEAARRAIARFTPDAIRPKLQTALEEVAAIRRSEPATSLPSTTPSPKAATAPSTPHIGHVGLLYRPQTSEGVVVGLRMAVDGLLGSLGRHGKVPAVVYASPRDVRAIERLLMPVTGGAVRVEDARELRDPARQAAVLAWHDLAFDADRPFAVRRRLGRNYPITLTHHSLSYRELLHNTLLRLLLEGPQPHDSIVCSTSAARSVIAKLLGAVGDEFNTAHGTHLAYRGRLDVIPLGVDVGEYRPRDRAQARERFRIPQNKFVFLWVGRLSAIDKADLTPLLTVLGRLKRGNSDRELLLVIAGTERANEHVQVALESFAAQAGVGSQVQFLRDLSSGMPELYAAADVFVSPVDNTQESFGLAPVEAMACGIPQVVSDWNGYRDTVVDGETGFRVPTLWGPCDEDLAWLAPFTDEAFEHLATSQAVAVDLVALEGRLQLLLDNEDLRRRLGEGSRRRAEATYAAQHVVAQHEALWNDLAQQARSDGKLPPAPLDYLPRVHAFDTYPTRMLDAKDLIALTPQGMEVTKGTVRVVMPFAAEGIHDTGVLRLCVQAILALGRAEGGATTGTVLSAILRRQPELPQSLVVRQLLWLVKQGFVQVGPRPTA